MKEKERHCPLTRSHERSGLVEGREREREMKKSPVHVLCMVNECGQTLTRKVDTGQAGKVINWREREREGKLSTYKLLLCSYCSYLLL